MTEDIKINDINDSNDDEMILKFLKTHKAKRCLDCHENNENYLCLCKNCGYYFCNNIHRKASHIVIHLRQCSHEKICKTPFDSTIRCHNCNNQNIMELNFERTKLSILCNKCSENSNNFEKIIQNKKINEKILLSPEVPPLANREDSISESIITQLNNKIKLQKKINLPSVRTNYPTKGKYCKIYSKLIENEIETIEDENLAEPSYEFYLKFQYIENNVCIAEIINIFQIQKFQFYNRQFLMISIDENEENNFVGKVIKIENNKIIIYCYLNKKYVDGIFKIKEKEITRSYISMLKGLYIFEHCKYLLMDINIRALIIGTKIKNFSNKNTYLNPKDIPTKINILELGNKRLNNSQEAGILNSFRNKLTIIRGAPGTGKSLVISVLAYHLVKLKKCNDKILICAPSNRAVDNIVLLLQKFSNIKFVRVLSKEKELSNNVEKANSLYSLATQDIYSNPKKNETLIKLIEKRKIYGLQIKEEELYKKLMKKFEQRILKSSDIILSTINNSADERLEDFDFPIVIIDEATQALEPDCLLTLYHGAEMVVLIGDEKQLGPTVISKEAEASGFDISLFERLCYYYKGSNFISTLKEQYRMHEFLYRFSNDKFYDNEIISKTKDKLDENIMENFPWPNKKIPSLFYHYTELEETENNSYYNNTEISYIYEIVKKWIEIGINSKDIGIITPYNAQKYRLCIKFSKNKIYENLKIESVDGFQGMEKKYIIISTVRSNNNGDIGFVSSKKRLNVAITRAQNGMVILGNCQCLSKKSKIWRDFIEFYYAKKIIVKGPFSDLEIINKNEVLGTFLYDEDNENFDIRKENKFFKEIKNYNNKNKNEKPAPFLMPNNIYINKINNMIDNMIEQNKKNNNESKIQISKKNKNKNKNKQILKESIKEKGNKKYQNKMKSKKTRNININNEEDKKGEKEEIKEEVEKSEDNINKKKKRKMNSKDENNKEKNKKQKKKQ